MESVSEETIKQTDAGAITRLAELPRDTILDIAAMAAVFMVVPRTIRRMERRYELPPSIKLRAKRCWKAGAVLDWIDAAFDRKEKEAKRQLYRLQNVC